jgi:hypothetical protein
MLAVSGAMLTLIEPQHGLHSLCSNPGVPGNIVRRGNGVMALECMEYNAADLPKSFGGTSGSGLWRAYLNVDEGRIVYRGGNEALRDCVISARCDAHRVPGLRADRTSACGDNSSTVAGIKRPPRAGGARSKIRLRRKGEWCVWR